MANPKKPTPANENALVPASENKPALPGEGARKFDRAIRTQHPGLTAKQATAARNEVLANMAPYVSEGFQPAVAKPNADGSMDIIVLSMEKKKPGGAK